MNISMDKATAEFITNAVNKINYYTKIKEGLKKGGKNATHVKLVHIAYGAGDAGDMTIEDLNFFCDYEIKNWVALLGELGVDWVSGEEEGSG